MTHLPLPSQSKKRRRLTEVSAWTGLVAVAGFISYSVISMASQPFSTTIDSPLALPKQLVVTSDAIDVPMPALDGTPPSSTVVPFSDFNLEPEPVPAPANSPNPGPSEASSTSIVAPTPGASATTSPTPAGQSTSPAPLPTAAPQQVPGAQTTSAPPTTVGPTTAPSTFAPTEPEASSLLRSASSRLFLFAGGLR